MPTCVHFTACKLNENTLLKKERKKKRNLFTDMVKNKLI